MDLFSKIDWQKLKDIISDIKIIEENYHSGDSRDDIELAKLFYQIEKDLAVFKKKFNLPYLNNNIDSESVINSFDKTPRDKDIFDKDNFLYNDFFRQNDFQYWLLIFLLCRNNEIREKEMTLYEIIDQFIGRIKEESLTWRDIEFTGSGATRCKTNCRFAFDDLKNVGLVNLYDKKLKHSWTLTYLGFFVAASFCLHPVDKEKKPFSKQITKFHQSTFYFRLNKEIWDRVHELSNVNYFQSIVNELKLDSLNLKELEKGPEIFSLYWKCVFDLQCKNISGPKRNKELGAFLTDLNARYSLENYTTELSLKFDAESFFAQLIKQTS